MNNQNVQKNYARSSEYVGSSEYSVQHPLSWKSVAAGFLVTLFTMTALLGLGMALGGISIDEDVSAKGASIFTSVWFLVSTIISLFVGSYYSARLSVSRVPKVGAANGILIASLFILFFLFQAFSAIGSIGKTARTLIESAALGAGKVAAGNPESTSMIASYVEEEFLDLDLRSSPQVVASGVASRLLSGNTEGAQNYLAYQAKIGPEEAQARIDKLQAQANLLLEDAKTAAANTLKATGWGLFFLIFSSAIAALLGGFLGSRRSIDHPVTKDINLLKAG